VLRRWERESRWNTGSPLTGCSAKPSASSCSACARPKFQPSPNVPSVQNTTKKEIERGVHETDLPPNHCHLLAAGFTCDCFDVRCTTADVQTGVSSRFGMEVSSW